LKKNSLALIAGGLFLSAASVQSAPMVELFTSQGCYSCPPADKHLAKLIARQPDVVALEFHVDYWDTLNYGRHGVWKDPFSSAAYSARQRSYNQQPLAGRRGVYTPQMVVNGATAQVGNQRGAVQAALDVAVPQLVVDARLDGVELTIDLAGKSSSKALVWVAVFDRQTSTEVPTGENHGKTMRNHHVVRELTPVADWRDGGGRAEVSLPALVDSNKGCAVFVQSQDNGPILGAAYCKPL